VKTAFFIHVFYIGLFLLACHDKIQAQDKIHLKDGTEVSCHITEIQDFILYAEVHDDPFLATFFADDVSHLDIDPKNTLIIRQLKQGVKEAMVFSNPLKENHLYGFYFGMPYDSVHNKSTTLYKTDSLGNPILVPYDPVKTDLSSRLKSMAKSLTGNSLFWLIGGL
tara:strand:+ start:761 stop:1258 length:498 start_codon:yes stop_codon:yes gene_type:complete